MSKKKGLLRKATSLIILMLTLPFALLVACIVLCGDGVAGVVARLRSLNLSPTPGTRQRDYSQASIVILNWNGRHLLAEGLLSVLRAVEQAGGKHEVIVVDNGSTDGSVDFVRQSFPMVKVVALERNEGFGRGNNIGVQAASNDIVVLLNNDMVVDPGFLPPLLRPFADERVFAVSARICMADPQKPHVETGLTRGRLCDGLLQIWHENIPPTSKQLRPCLWAGGGSSAFDRRRFLELGGFSSLYAPFYVEDVDLSYRAWKRGWSIFFAPESVVYHYHQSSTSRFGADYMQQALATNMRLFVWHNITDKAWTLTSFLRLPRDVARDRGRRHYRSLLLALQRLPWAIWLRWLNKATPGEKLSDRAVFSLSQSAHYYKEHYCAPVVLPSDRRKRILILCPYSPVPPAHGGAVRMFNLIKNLAQNNDVDVLSFIEHEDEECFIATLKPYCRRVRFVLRQSRRHYRPLQDRSWHIEEFDTPEMRQALLEMLDDEDYHVIQIEYAQMAQYHPGTRRCLTVLDEVDVFFQSFYRQRIAGRHWPRLQDVVDYLKIARYEIESCCRFDYVLTMSATNAAYLAEFLPDRKHRIVEVANGVDTSYYTPSSGTDSDELLFIGSYRHTPNREGIRYFLKEIFPLIQREVPAVRLTIVGDGPWAQMPEVCHQPAVTVTGFVEDIRPYLTRCAVSIAPILAGSGTRIKILESMAAGLPVVSTSIGCEGIDAHPGEDILIGDTPAEFAQAVVRVLRDQTLAARLRRNARCLVEERYNWQTIVAHLDQLYNDWIATP